MRSSRFHPPSVGGVSLLLMGISILQAIAATPLDVWHLRNPAPVSASLLISVARGNGVFLAVGSQSDVAVSTDGIRWTREPFPETNRTGFLTGVAFGNGRFVAVDGSTNLWITADGRSWSMRGIDLGPFASGPNRIAFANGLFVAVGYPGLILTSIDAERWSIHRVDPSADLSGVAYGNGLFVVVGAGGALGQSIFTSPDGETWTSRDSANHPSLSSVAFGNGRFIAVDARPGTGPSRPLWILTSGDGIVWSQEELTGFNSCSDWGTLTFVNGQFWATGEFNTLDCSASVGNLLSSVDGTEWQPHPVGDRNTVPYDLTFADGQLVTVGVAYQNGNPFAFIASSSDGASWTRRDSGVHEPLSDVAYGDGIFVAVGHSVTTNGTILTSTDGVQWTRRNPGVVAALRKVAHGNGRFVVVGWDRQVSPAAPLVLVSTNGVDWFRGNLGTTNLPTSVTFGNGVFAAIAAGDTVATSADGERWSTSAGPDNGFQSCTAIAAGKGLFVAVGNRVLNGGVYETRIFTSVDGLQWVRRPFVADVSLRAIAFGNGGFVAIPTSGPQVLTSPDGIQWTAHTVPFDAEGESSTRYALAFGGGRFLAAGQNGSYHSTRIYSSTDGQSWDSRSAGVTQWLFGLGAGAGTVVAVGDYGIVVQSDPLIPAGTPLRLKSPQWLAAPPGFGFSVEADPGTPLRIQASADLVHWDTVAELTVQDGPLPWRDEAAGDSRFKFYRAVTP